MLKKISTISVILKPGMVCIAALCILAMNYSCKKNTDNNIPGQLPELTTEIVSDITATGAKSGGNITSPGNSAITARGVCWSTGVTPTIADNKTSDGTGTGMFSSVLSGLSSNTTYYVRAYATNSTGTAYGNTLSFTNETVTDIDGHVYTTVKLGTQTWMVENLKTTKFRNGASIIFEPDNIAWTTGNAAKYCNYGPATPNGLLYNWYAVNSASKLAPAGWHIPTSEEWETLKNYLIANRFNYDSSNTGNKIAKAMGTAISWISSPGIGTVGNTDYPTFRNKTGFSGYPSGFRRSSDGSFTSLGSTTRWWTATEADATLASYYSIDYFFSDLKNNTINKLNGCSVRCIKD